MVDFTKVILPFIFGLIVLTIVYNLAPSIVKDLGNTTLFSEINSSGGDNQTSTTASTLFNVIIPVMVALGLLVMIVKGLGLKLGGTKRGL